MRMFDRKIDQPPANQRPENVARPNIASPSGSRQAADVQTGVVLGSGHFPRGTMAEEHWIFGPAAEHGTRTRRHAGRPRSGPAQSSEQKQFCFINE